MKIIFLIILAVFFGCKTAKTTTKDETTATHHTGRTEIQEGETLFITVRDTVKFRDTIVITKFKEIAGTRKKEVEQQTEQKEDVKKEIVENTQKETKQNFLSGTDKAFLLFILLLIFALYYLDKRFKTNK